MGGCGGSRTKEVAGTTTQRYPAVKNSRPTRMSCGTAPTTLGCSTRGPDDALVWRAYEAGQWNAEERFDSTHPVPTRMGSAPSVIAGWAGTRFAVFFRGSDGRLRWKAHQGGRWHNDAEVPGGGELTSNPDPTPYGTAGSADEVRMTGASARRSVLVTVAATMIGTIGLVGVVVGQIPDAAGTIQACYTKTGALRVIDIESGQISSAEEAPLSWNAGPALIPKITEVRETKSVTVPQGEPTTVGKATVTLTGNSDLVTTSTMTVQNQGTETAQVELTLLLDGERHIDDAHVFAEDIPPGYTVTLNTSIGCNIIRPGTHTLTWLIQAVKGMPTVRQREFITTQYPHP